LLSGKSIGVAKAGQWRGKSLPKTPISSDLGNHRAARGFGQHHYNLRNALRFSRRSELIMAGGLVTKSHLSEWRTACILSERLLGGIPFVDGRALGRPAYDECRYLRSSKSLFGYFVDLIGDFPVCFEIRLAQDMRSLPLNSGALDDTELLRWIGTLVDSVDGLEAEFCIPDISDRVSLHE
jgi:hypothetical protein